MYEQLRKGLYLFFTELPNNFEIYNVAINITKYCRENLIKFFPPRLIRFVLKTENWQK